MKRSKKSRSRNTSPSQSSRKSVEPSSVRGLVTSRQQTIKTASQVSAYTQKTARTSGFTDTQDFDNIDYDLEKEQIREVFISEEEEQVIQKILEVARKGKINQKNAFEIPLKVLDNQNVTIGQAKFWKFAAQLLGASINIYQKRIENTWTNTNIIHEKLARMAMGKQKNEDNDQNQNNDNKAENPEFLTMSIEEFRNSKILDNVRVGEQTLEEAHRINIVNLKKQFTDDPLFQKKLKTFDNTSLKGLLVNVFDLSSKCQIELFSSQNKLLPKSTDKSIPKQQMIPAQQKLIDGAIRNAGSHKNFTIFASITDFKDKNTISFHNSRIEGEVVDSVGFVRNQRSQKSYEPFQQQLQAFINTPHDGMQSQMGVVDAFLNDDFSNNDDHFEVKTMAQTRTLANEFLNDEKFSYNSMRTDNSPFLFSSEGQSSENGDMSFHSVMTPWELEFREGKLRKKSTKKRSKKEGKSREKVEQFQIQFDPREVLKRAIVLAPSSKQPKATRKNKKKGVNNLIPPQLAVYQKINYRKVVQSKIAPNNWPSKQQQTNHEDLADFLAPDPSMLDIDPEAPKTSQQPTGLNLNTGDLYAIGEQQLRVLGSGVKQNQAVSQRYNNIRETKQRIFEKTKEERELRISEVELEHISPASILITFLHLANEKNLIVRSTQDEDDVILSWE